MPELKSELKQLADAGDELAKRERDWTKRWTVFLKELDLPTDWTPKIADVTLSRLHEARREYQKITPMEKRLEEIRGEVERFDDQTQSLCRNVAEDLVDLPPEQAVETLHSRLEEAKGAAIQKKTALEAREIAERQKETVESRLAELQAKRESLLETAGIEGGERRSESSIL